MAKCSTDADCATGGTCNNGVCTQKGWCPALDPATVEAFYPNPSDFFVTFGQVIDAVGLLVRRTVSFTVEGGATRSEDFRMVDADALAALPADIVEELHRSGVLALVHAHLLSLGNMERVAQG